MMFHRKTVLIAACLLLATAPLLGSDWNQWRGALRSGVAPDETPLLERWPEGGPTKLWESEPWSGKTGYSCPVVSEGRVYVLLGWQYKEPVITRTLTKDEMKRVGCFEKKPEGALLEKIEAARVSEELGKLSGREVNNWIKKWLSENLSKEELKQHGSFAKDRLKRGKRALSLEILDSLLPIKDKEFPNAAELEKWLDEQGITGEAKGAVTKAFPAEIVKANDTLLCMSDTDGTTLWKYVHEGAPENRKTCSTPCVAGNKVFVAGSTGMVYCLDAVEGKEIWKSDIAASKGQGINSSPVVMGDTMFLLAGVLTAFDVNTGKVKWRQEQVKGRDTSPTPWTHDGTPYVICNTDKKLYCVKADNGEVAWSVKSSGKCSPAVSGKYAVIVTSKKDAGFICFEISPEGAKELWKAPLGDSYVSPVIYGEHAYATAEKKIMCVELASGKVLWNVDLGTDKASSPAVADGVLINVKKGGVVMAKITPEACELRGEMKCKVLQYTSPSLANGRLYLKMAKHIACYQVGDHRGQPSN